MATSHRPAPGPSKTTKLLSWWMMISLTALEPSQLRLIAGGGGDGGGGEGLGGLGGGGLGGGLGGGGLGGGLGGGGDGGGDGGGGLGGWVSKNAWHAVVQIVCAAAQHPPPLQELLWHVERSPEQHPPPAHTVAQSSLLEAPRVCASVQP